VKRILFCLLLAALPSIGGSREAIVASVAPIAPVVIYSQFEAAPSAEIQDALQDEIETIMSPAGLHFEWRDLAGSRSSTAVELVVVTFKGQCDLRSLQPVGVLPGALGWTHVSNGVVLPFSDVDCTAVRDFLQKDLLSRPAPIRQEIYGRALGRVLAHELYHVLAATSNHSGCGVAKAGYTVDDLVSPVFVFESAALRTLLQSKSHQILERAAASLP